MKKYIFLIVLSFFAISCNGQTNKAEKAEAKRDKDSITEFPKGSWKVDKEFDENGNLIRYDSIYSWSSNDEYGDLSSLHKDSLMQSFKTRFYSNFSSFKNQGFEDVFSNDSLFNKHFFNDSFFGSNFGKEFMDIDKLRQQMIERQKKFLEKYQSRLIKPEDEN